MQSWSQHRIVGIPHDVVMVPGYPLMVLENVGLVPLETTGGSGTYVEAPMQLQVPLGARLRWYLPRVGVICQGMIVPELSRSPKPWSLKPLT